MNPQIRAALIQFFQQNPYPNDILVHQLSKRLGINPHQLETHIYALLTDLLKGGSVGQPPWAPRWRKRMGICPYETVGQPPWAPRWRKRMGMCPYENPDRPLRVGFVCPPQVRAGKHRDVSESEYDPQQLRMGIKVQREHTDDPRLAREIAKDHLSEIPDYYTRLLRMQRQAGIND